MRNVRVLLKIIMLTYDDGLYSPFSHRLRQEAYLKVRVGAYDTVDGELEFIKIEGGNRVC